MNILVVDDSAYNRQVLAELLASLDFVTSASSAVDGVDAFNQVMKVGPDLILLDLEMPNMDGFTFLRILRIYRSTPVIVVSGLEYEPDGFKAVRLGADGFISKPSMAPSKRLSSVRYELVKSIKAVAAALPPTPGVWSGPGSAGRNGLSPTGPGVEAVVIGASTGGPKAVSNIVSMLPRELPFAVIVTVHIPDWLTDSFIDRLRQAVNRDSSIEVRRARDSEVISSGCVTVAPGGYHIGFERRGAEVVTTLEKGNLKDGCAPSIDRMFSSAASVWGRSLVGVIMTGMGNDGQRGVVEIKERGGYVIAESERSSVISSMPSSAISTGRVDEVLTSGEIGLWINKKRSVLFTGSMKYDTK